MIVTPPFDEETLYLPFFGYYLAHDAPVTSAREHDAHLSGVHSSVDYDFCFALRELVESMNLRLIDQAMANGTEVQLVVMPKLANIVRDYRSAKLKHQIAGGIIKRLK